VPAKHVPHFKAGKEMRERVNSDWYAHRILSQIYSSRSQVMGKHSEQ
jgi:hypothetical protein